MLMHAVMYCAESMYVAQRRFALCGRSNAANPDVVMLACVGAGTFLDLDSPAGWKHQAEKLAGWTYIPL